MKNKTELLSFFDPERSYSEQEVRGVIIDLDVVQNVLIATSSSGDSIPLGQWSADMPNDLIDIKVLPTDVAITSTMLNGEKYRTPDFKIIDITPTTYLGIGQHIGSAEYVRTNDHKDDLKQGESLITYAISVLPILVEETNTHIITATGVDISANNVWSGSYSVAKTLNRKMDTLSDGLLGDGQQLILTYTFPQPIRFVGYDYSNLRNDYHTKSYVVEYSEDGTNWVEFDRVDVDSDRMGHYEKMVGEIPVLAVRWKSLTHGSAPGVGYFNVFTGLPGKVEEFEELEFDSNYFNVTETADEIILLPTPPSGEAPVVDSVPLGLLKYVKLTSKVNKGTNLFLNSKSVEVIPLNLIETDSIGLVDRLPGVRLPKGSYNYRINFTPGSRTSSGRYFLASGASSILPIDRQFLIPGEAGTDNHMSQPVCGTGSFKLRETTDLFLKRENFLDSIGALSLTDNEPVATLEIWQTDTSPVFVPMDVPLKPSAEMQSANWRVLESFLNTGANHDNLTNGLLGSDVGLDLTTSSHFLRFYVDEPFRLWVNSSTVAGPAKLERCAKGVTRITKGITELLNQDNLWQLYSEDLPAGEYKISFDAIRRADREWFLEYVENPVYGVIKVGNAIKPMTSATDQGQVVTESSAYTSGHVAWQTCKDVVGYYGWVSANGAPPTPGSPQWMEIEFVGVDKAITGFAVGNRSTSGAGAIRDFELWGWNETASDWDVLYTVTSRVNAAVAGRDEYLNIGNHTYSKFRLQVTAIQDSSPFLAMGKFELFGTEQVMRDDWI